MFSSSKGFVVQNLQGTAAATNSLTEACLAAHTALESHSALNPTITEDEKQRGLKHYN